MFEDFDNLFNFFPSTTEYNWEKLKKMGKVTEDKVVDNKTGLTTITRTFETAGGAFTISSTESYYGATEGENRINTLKKKLDEAVNAQKYEEAINIRDELKSLKKDKKNSN